MFKERIKKGPNGRLIKDRLGKSFTLHHAFEELENDEKWRARDVLEVPTVVDDGDEACSGEDGKRSPTPNSVARTKRPEGRKEDGQREGQEEAS